jgi:predicted NUDIX family NTP pyrophosphohydrolase
LSAGLLLYRRRPDIGDIVLEVLLAHMGGPFWVSKDAGAWTIPKGEYEPGDDAFEAAQREFAEELGSAPPPGDYHELGWARQPGGKVVVVWAAEADFDVATTVSNTFELEWPRGSGRTQSFPEIDRAEWFAVDVARAKLVKGQLPFLDRVLTLSGPS